jgi:hypothetical protein
VEDAASDQFPSADRPTFAYPPTDSRAARKQKFGLLKWTRRVFHNFLSKSGTKCKFLPANFEYTGVHFAGQSKVCGRPIIG